MDKGLESSRRSVWTLARPLPNQARHLQSSSLAFAPCWALLLSDLTDRQLPEVLRQPLTKEASLGDLWSFKNCHGRIEAVIEPSYSIRQHCDYPISIQYCGETGISDASIMHERLQYSLVATNK